MQQHKLIYAGIGSRNTPDHILQVMQEIGRQLAPRWTLRSGHADGADMAFEMGCVEAGGKKEIFIPWKGFNKAIGPEYICKTPSDYELGVASNFHPNWAACSPAARLLHTRNLYQIAGANLDEPVQMVICWTPNASASGGTGQAIRIARFLNIPVFDLADESCWEPLVKFSEEAEAWVPEVNVVNRHHGTKGEYIGRGTPLGNPFKEGTREENVAEYRTWLLREINEGNACVIAELDRLAEIAWEKPLNLVCSCAPKACHGDVVKELLLQVMTRRQEDRMPWE